MARCTIERLMRQMQLQGVRRGKVVRTTIPDQAAACTRDKVNRQFKSSRPNELWVSDFTYVSTWQGWLYVAFVIDVFARRIVGWQVSRSMQTDFVIDALEQELYERQPENNGLIHHSDRYVEEQFHYDGFARFSHSLDPFKIATLSLQTRPYARDMKNARFEQVFRSRNYEVDASRAAKLGTGPLAQINRKKSQAFEPLLGHLPADL